MEDIVMRMQPDHSPRTDHGDEKVRNALNMRASRRAYPAFFMISWHAKGLEGDRKHSARDFVLASLSADQTLNNTTRGKTPGRINPDGDDSSVNRIAQPELPVGALQRRFQGRGNRPRQSRKKSKTDSSGSDSSFHANHAPRMTRTRANPHRTGRKSIQNYFESSDEDSDDDSVDESYEDSEGGYDEEPLTKRTKAEGVRFPYPG